MARRLADSPALCHPVRTGLRPRMPDRWRDRGRPGASNLHGLDRKRERLWASAMPSKSASIAP